MADVDYLAMCKQLADKGACDPGVITAYALIALVQEVRRQNELLTDVKGFLDVGCGALEEMALRPRTPQ